MIQPNTYTISELQFFNRQHESLRFHPCPCGGRGYGVSPKHSKHCSIKLITDTTIAPPPQSHLLPNQLTAAAPPVHLQNLARPKED